MAGKVLSISLGSEIVKVCEVMHAGKNKIRVFNAIDLIIPEGLCDDGVILDAPALADAIKQGLQGEGFSAKRIVFTITSKRIANKEAVIPFCKENRIKDIIQINASEYFPITNLDNYTFNYSIIEVIVNEGVKNYRLSVTATPNEMIEQYYELAKAMGMSVETIDYSGNSILQLLKLQTAGEGVDAVLQVGAENTVVNIMNGSTMVMQRSVPYGRLSLADAIASSRGITDDEADMVLISEDLRSLTAQYPDVADATRSMLSSIGRILEFYRARNAEQPIERVFMIGDVTSVNGLPELINNEMDYEVEVVERLRGVEIRNRNVLSDEIVANYLANIGAVINPLRIAISQDKKGDKAKGENLPWWMLVFAAAVAAAMCGGILFVYYTNEKENTVLRSQIAAIEDVSILKTQYEQSQSDVQIMENWYDTTKGANESLARFINELEEVQPKAVAITKFSSSSGEVTIDGYSYGKPAAAQFIMELKKLPYVSSVKMDYLNESIEDYAAKDTFVIHLMLEYDDPYKDQKSDTEGETDGENALSNASEVVSVEEVTNETVTGITSGGNEGHENSENAEDTASGQEGIGDSEGGEE